MANIPRVLMKIELDGEERCSEEVSASDKESLEEMAHEYNPDIREGRATLSTILVFSKHYKDYIGLDDSHRFKSGDKFRLLYSTRQLQRSRPATSGWISNTHDDDDDSYHIRGTWGEAKIDLSVDKNVAIAAGVGVGIGAALLFLGTGGSSKKGSK